MMHKINTSIVKSTAKYLHDEKRLGTVFGKILQLASSTKYELYKIDSLNNSPQFKVLWSQSNSIQCFPIPLNYNQKAENTETKRNSLGYSVFKNASVFFATPFVFTHKVAYIQKYWCGEKSGAVDYKRAPFILSNSRTHLMVLHQKVQIIDRGILLAGSYDLNWYHWIIEVLSKKELFNLLPDNLKAYPLIISANKRMSKNHLDALKVLFPENEILFIDEAHEYQVKNLIALDSPALGLPKSKFADEYRNASSNIFEKELMARLSKSFSKDLEQSSTRKRILIGRKQTNRTYNQDELYERLKKFNFEIVYPEEMSFVQQRQTFHTASFIIGMTGAGWANLIFCSPNTKAIIIAPKMVEQLSTFPNIAKVVGVDFYEYSYPSKEKTWFEYMNKNYQSIVDFDPLEKSLNQILNN